MRQARPEVTGPEAGPEPPFPIRLSGPVVKGFGRGSKELGIPTANIPAEALSEYPDLQIGVYYGVAALDPNSRTEGASSSTTSQGAAVILPVVLSIGYNPFYKNKERSIEIHIMAPLTAPSPTATATTTDNPEKEVKFHKLPDFYGTPLHLLILGHIRPELDYVSLEALVEDIRIDCEVARQSLRRKAYVGYLGEGQGDESESDEIKVQRQWLTTFDSQQNRTSGL